jgi:hypothetical protein
MSDAELDLLELMTREEELHDDLKPWVVKDGPFGPMLKHPLVQEIILDTSRCARVNMSYAFKLEAIADAKIKQQWDRYIFLRERPYRPMILQEVAEMVEGPAYWNLVRQVWVDSENCWEYHDEWYDMLTADPAGREFMSDEDVRCVFTLPPEVGGLLPETPIYRGFAHDDALDGFSWTLDRARAKWFARRAAWRKGDVPRVATAKVKREHVIAYITSRDEQEIVLLPEHAMIEKVQEVSDQP